MKEISSHKVICILFLAICVLVGVSLGIGLDRGVAAAVTGGLLGGVFAILVILIDLSLRGVTIKTFSFGTVGLLIGLLCGWLVTRLPFFEAGWLQQFEEAGQVFNLAILLAFGFIGMMLALRSRREEFSLLIPYVRFRQDSLQEAPLLLDAGIIIDGRVDRLCETGFIGVSLVVPRFVLDELQGLSESRTESKRIQGSRGLEHLKALQSNGALDVTIYEDESKETSPEAKLAELARRLNARILAVDPGVTKVARLKGVSVLNIHELASALKVVMEAGDEVELHLIKAGKDEGQAVGYLTDGTMVVVNRGAEWIGSRQKVIIGSSMQTSSGRLFFADLAK